MIPNGLAVRTGPGMSFEMVAGYRFDTATNTERFVTDAVRLASGHFLFVDQGPLVVDGVPWLRVYSGQQPNEAPEDTMRWDADGDDLRFDHGWIASASADGDAYVVADEPPAEPGPVYGPGPEPFAFMAATGSATSDPFTVGTSRALIDWFAIDPDGGLCTLAMILEPTGEVLATETVNGLTSGRAVFTSDRETPFALAVESDCTWSMHALPEQG